MATEVERARELFSLEEYDRMVTAGVFGPEDRLGLIEGEIVVLSPIGDEHAAGVDTLTRLFVRGVGDDAIVRVQGPVGLRQMVELRLTRRRASALMNFPKRWANRGVVERESLAGWTV